MMRWGNVGPGTMFFPPAKDLDESDPPNCIIVWSVPLDDGNHQLGILYPNGDLHVEEMNPDERADDNDMRVVRA